MSGWLQIREIDTEEGEKRVKNMMIEKVIRNIPLTIYLKLSVIHASHCINTHTYLEWQFFHLGWQCSPQIIDHVTKTPSTGMRSPLLCYWSGLFKRLPKHYIQVWLRSTPGDGKYIPVAEDTYISDLRPRETWARTDLNTFSFRTSCCGFSFFFFLTLCFLGACHSAPK